jgi:hypothetical protein
MRPGTPKRKKKSEQQRTRRRRKGWLNRWRVNDAFIRVTELYQISADSRKVFLLFSGSIKGNPDKAVPSPKNKGRLPEPAFVGITVRLLG